ncbi:uncharacterized protein LOC119675818 [Teleopsis dalmanni]|uniref:uncharacterized protein LOC119675818 n=1 Tax=Teleopsis dalmanni TaxID=139649 RepID=UPI0018CD921F|nr:uncharacterized protein LOC119675818 [Teleopsis dalmanni]
MFFKILMWLFAITAYFSTQTNCFEMNMTDYYKMPSLYDFDDYDRCLTEFNNLSTYCFVRADVIPKNDSVSWRVITEISKYNKHHFNHRHLYFGLCVKWCEDALSQFQENGTDELFAGILTNNTKVSAN